MSKLKSILLMGLSYVLIAALAIGGTIAYLKDEDETANVMTLGNVYIEQHEYERVQNADGTYKTATIDDRTSYVLKEFSQAKPLYPAIIPNGGTVNGVTWDYDATPVRMSQVNSYGGASVFNTPNAVDKFVTVENTGKTDAYVRTLVAFEMGSISADRYFDVVDFEIRANDEGDCKQPWQFKFSGVITVDGNNYYLMELIYCGALLSNGSYRHANGVLPAGDTTYPNLCQVYMAAEATNEDCANIDGNGNGTFEILVLSQAVQAVGFDNAELALDTAFGDIDANNHPWSGKAPELPVLVEDQKGLDSAIKSGEKDIIVNNGNIAISGRPSAHGADITFSGGTVNNGTTGGFNKGLIDNGTLVYNNVTIVGSVSLYGEKVVFNNCTFDLTGISDYIWTYGAKVVEFNNCTFNTKGKAILVYNEGAVGSSEVTVNGCTFNASESAYASAVPGQPCAAVEIDSSYIPGTYTLNFVGDNVVDSDFSGLVRIKSDGGKGNVVINGATAVPLP